MSYDPDRWMPKDHQAYLCSFIGKNNVPMQVQLHQGIIQATMSLMYGAQVLYCRNEDEARGRYMRLLQERHPDAEIQSVSVAQLSENTPIDPQRWIEVYRPQYGFAHVPAKIAELCERGELTDEGMFEYSRTYSRKATEQ